MPKIKLDKWEAVTIRTLLNHKKLDIKSLRW